MRPTCKNDFRRTLTSAWDAQCCTIVDDLQVSALQPSAMGGLHISRTICLLFLLLRGEAHYAAKVGLKLIIFLPWTLQY